MTLNFGPIVLERRIFSGIFAQNGLPIETVELRKCIEAFAGQIDQESSSTSYQYFGGLPNPASKAKLPKLSALCSRC